MIGFEREEDEITGFYRKIQATDNFGVWGTELLLRVSFKKATPFMKADHGWDEESWEKAMKKKDHDFVVGEIEDYFQFALEKAIGHRGLSASRSVHYFLAWSWLLNDMDLFGYLMEPRNYANYGCPLILAVAQRYGMDLMLPTNPYDKEVFFNMAMGRRCSALCPGGCGRGEPGVFMPLVMPANDAAKKLILPK